MKKMNMVIAQSGGPSMVINGSLVAAVIFAKTDGKAKIGKIYGARHGIQGILARDYLDLRKVPFPKLRGLLTTPSSASNAEIYCSLTKAKPKSFACTYEVSNGRSVGSKSAQSCIGDKILMSSIFA